LVSSRLFLREEAAFSVFETLTFAPILIALGVKTGQQYPDALLYAAMGNIHSKQTDL